MGGPGAAACRGHASGAVFLPLPSNPGTNWGFHFFSYYFEDSCCFSPIRRWRLSLPLSCFILEETEKKAFCARTLNRWSQWQGHQVHGLLVMHRRGGRLTKLSKLTCPSGPEPQGPGSRVVADSSCPGKCSVWNTTWRRTVAWSLSILPEALTESKKEDNFSLSTACTCRGVWCSKDVGKIAVWKASGQEERRRTAQQQLRNV